MISIITFMTSKYYYYYDYYIKKNSFQTQLMNNAKWGGDEHQLDSRYFILKEFLNKD